MNTTPDQIREVLRFATIEAENEFFNETKPSHRPAWTPNPITTKNGVSELQKIKRSRNSNIIQKRAAEIGILFLQGKR